jgi:hypothetical protein
MKKILFLLAIAAFSAAAATDTYNLTLFQPSIVSGKELEPGEYKLIVNETQAVFKKGSIQVEASVKVETTEQKHRSTTVRYENGDGKLRVSEIRLGGTNRKLVFN